MKLAADKALPLRTLSYSRGLAACDVIIDLIVLADVIIAALRGR